MKAGMRDGLRLLKSWAAADISIAKGILKLLLALLIVCTVMVPIIYPLLGYGYLHGSVLLAICAALGVGFGIHQARRPGAYLLLGAAVGIFGGVGVLGAPNLPVDLPLIEDPWEYLALIAIGTLSLSLIVGLCGGLIAALGTGFRAYLILAVVAGIPIGLATPNYIAAFTASLLAGFATSPFRGRRIYLALTVLGPIGGAISFSVALVLMTNRVFSWVDPLFGGLEGLIVGVSVLFGQRLGHYVGHHLRQGLDEFSGAAPYLREMVRPLIGFTVIYFCIVVVFGALFASACTQFTSDATFDFRPGRDDGTCKPYYGHFLYLSLMTMSTLGHDDLNNASPLIQSFIIAEVVIGIAWIVVVFAALISYLEDKRDQPQWESLHREREKVDAERQRADMEREKTVWAQQRADAAHERARQLEADLQRAREQLKEAQRNAPNQ